MKQILKSEIFEKRKSLSKREIDEKSAAIREKLFSLNRFKDAKNIMFYVSFNNEVNTIEMIKELLKNKKENKKNIIVPYVEKNNPILQLSKLNSFDDLEPKTFGILEPKADKIRKLNIDDLDLVIVPGIVFDKNGHRIGYGHGYYDGFLKKIRAKKVGLAFELQLIEKIPEEGHDVPVDFVITEKRIVEC